MSKNAIIFYAEDDIDDQDIFKEVLANLERKDSVYVQKNGNELLDILHKNEIIPDLIFLDLNMPGRTGFDVLDEIRQFDNYKHVPVIVLSTSDNQFGADHAKKIGANLYVTKPQSYSDFKELMVRILKIDWKQKRVDDHIFYVNVNV